MFLYCLISSERAVVALRKYYSDETLGTPNHELRSEQLDDEEARQRESFAKKWLIELGEWFWLSFRNFCFIKRNVSSGKKPNKSISINISAVKHSRQSSKIIRRINSPTKLEHQILYDSDFIVGAECLKGDKKLLSRAESPCNNNLHEKKSFFHSEHTIHALQS